MHRFVGDRTSLPAGQYMSITSWLAYPYSRGRVHIRSPECSLEPVFDAGFLSDVEGLDLEMLVWAYRKGHSIMRSFPFYRGEADVEGKLGAGHPKEALLRDGSLADANGPIEDYIRRTVCSAGHSMGTCAMGSSQRGVVDAKMAVYGVTGLRCADMSICPTNLGTNTASVAMTIGEKAAFVFLENLAQR